MELYEGLLAALREGTEAAGRDYPTLPTMMEIKVSYDPDLETAKRACEWWGALALTSDEKSGIEDPLELERLADADPQRVTSRFIVSDDPDQVVEAIAPYVELGFDELIFHHPGADQAGALEALQSGCPTALSSSAGRDR